MRTVAALYVDPRGPYPGMEGVDCWDESRDAMLYGGPWPVVAHPPCGPWGSLKHLYTGAEHDCGPRAVEQVRAFGGVLEHPKGSKLWDACALPKPGHGFDAAGGFSIAVNQVDWGHVCKKPTWLYLVGIAYPAGRPEPREPTRSVNGRRGAATQAKYPTWKEQLPRCSDAQRRRTPIAFAEWLVSLARQASQERAA